MYQANAASNALVHILYLCVRPHCSYYVTINDGISSPYNSEANIKGDCPLCISKLMSSLFNGYMNICKTTLQSHCRTKSLLKKILYADAYLFLFYLLDRMFLFLTQSPHNTTSLSSSRKKEKSELTYNSFSNTVLVWQVR